MTTEYRIRLDRTACEGIFACLVRDDRFVEAADGLATVADGPGDGRTADDADPAAAPDGGGLVAAFDDDRIDEARAAARACPVDAIAVVEEDG